ncbi:phage/plasmid primase, P4 family [Intestinibacter bartlettii]|uniref:phage/plasmid primase, P4 family n=1 Tax=Intestinibacter bartlettii TaxID=261299 RepID=UPI0034A2E0DE
MEQIVKNSKQEDGKSIESQIGLRDVIKFHWDSPNQESGKVDNESNIIEENLSDKKMDLKGMKEVIRFIKEKPEDISEEKQDSLVNCQDNSVDKISSKYNINIENNNLSNTNIKNISVPNEVGIINDKTTENFRGNKNEILKEEVCNKDNRTEQQLRDILNNLKEDNINRVDEKKKHVYSTWIKQLINSNLFINIENSALYMYYYQLRIYKIVEGNEGISLLKSFFYNTGETDISYDQYNKLIKDLITEPKICVNTDMFYKSSMLLNCKNGVLELETMKFIQNIYPNLQYFRIYIEANFIDGFSCYNEALDKLVGYMPNFNRFLLTSLQGSQQRVRAMFEIIGYCLSNVKPVKKIFICEGANDSGKSLVMKFITTLLTEYSDNNVVANLSLSQLSRKFSNQLIESAKLICSGEIDSNSKAIDMSTVKKITGGDSIVVERKFCDPKVIIPRAKLLFNTNEPLDISGESTYAMIKRIHTIKFPVSIPESQQDPNLLEYILNERDTIVTISMWALREVLQRGEFTKDPDYIELEERYIAQVPELVIDKFISEQIVIDKFKFITISDLEELYCNYCLINDYVCLKNNKFMKIFKSKLPLKFDVVENEKIIKGIAKKGDNN